MRKSRFTESRIVAILKEGEAGVGIRELTRKHGISRATYFCDGSFDLNSVVQPFLAKAGSQTDGTLLCSGTRTAAGMTRQPCKLRADYWVSAQHQGITRAAG